ncbi:MAG TPA: folate-binding protein [Caulobacteraceae bacterium]|nr:folate-binding protein [Caulobacteraceae bacterium]
MPPPAPKLSHLRSRALVAVRGPDWRGFLQGLLTQDVDSLRAGEWRYGALLTPQGRLLFDLFLVGETGDAGVLLDVPSAERGAIAQRLSLYRLRAKVEIGAAEGGVFALWGADAAGAGWAADPRLPGLGWRAVGLTAPSAPGAQDADEDEYEAHRLALGATDAWRDGLQDKSYPVEANLDLLNGVDFRKGCFVGQETTSRMKRRGQIRTRMLPIVFEGAAPAVGSEVLAGTLRAGEVTGGRDGRALALLRLDRLSAGPLTVDGRPVRAEPPDWMPMPAQGAEDD